MPIYYGGSKISEVYKGSDGIKELYNGSDLVYKKNTAFKCFGINSSNSGSFYIFNELAIGSFIIMPQSNLDALGRNNKLTKITGSLGTSGSSIAVTGMMIVSNSATYKKTIKIGGTNFYIYIVKDGFDNENWGFVQEGSEIGSYIIWGGTSAVVSLSGTSGTYRGNGGTTLSFTLTPSKDCFWSKELGFYTE